MGSPDTSRRATVRRVVTWTVLAAGILALIGLVVLWPRGDAPSLGFPPSDYVDATVVEVSEDLCDSTEVLAQTECFIATISIDSGAVEGDTGEFVVAADQFDVPTVEVGDRVVVLDVPTSPPPYRYAFVDFQRGTPMLAFVVLFVFVVVVFGRWKGVRALFGLATSALILVAFVVPALLRDGPEVLIALTGTVAIAVAALYLAHGFTMSTTVALAGTLGAVLVTAALAVVAASATQLTGLADDDAQVLRVTADALDLRGLLVAGIVVGALGVIDDVTVTQVSTVAALRRADPSMGPRALYREAVHVGRDHIASTVNTLVLAYAGAALPLVLLFAQGTTPITRILGSEVVAVEIIRMMVGSVGLVLSVPITTALAAVTLEPSDVGGHDHGHGAGHDHGIPPGEPTPAPNATAADAPTGTVGGAGRSAGGGTEDAAGAGSKDAADGGDTADTGSTAETGSTPDAGNSAETGSTPDAGNSADTGNTEGWDRFAGPSRQFWSDDDN